MKFRKEHTTKYYCTITDYLDKLVGMHSVFGGHYIVVDERGIENQWLEIMVPGRCTVGELFIDKEKRIAEIHIKVPNACFVYKKNPNEELKQYIGEKVEL